MDYTIILLAYLRAQKEIGVLARQLVELQSPGD